MRRPRRIPGLIHQPSRSKALLKGLPAARSNAMPTNDERKAAADTVNKKGAYEKTAFAVPATGERRAERIDQM